MDQITSSASAPSQTPSPAPSPAPSRTCLHCKWARPGKDFLSKKTGKWEWVEVDPSAQDSEGNPVSPSSWRCFCFSLSGKGDRLLPRLLEEPDLCGSWEPQETPVSKDKLPKEGGKSSKGKSSKPKSSSSENKEIQG